MRLDNCDKNMANMSDAIASDMQRIVRLAAGPRQQNDNVKAMIARAARNVGLNYRRARTFWYGGGVVLAAEAEAIRAAELRLLAERHRRLQQETLAIKARLNALKSDGDDLGVGMETDGGAAGSARVSIAGDDVQCAGSVADPDGVISDARQFVMRGIR